MAGPLTGCTIGITGHRRWEEQAEMLVRRGAEVVHGPVIHTAPLHDSDATVRATEALVARPPDVVVLTTGLGVRSWFAAAEGAGLDQALLHVCAGATVLARGPKARSAALGAGLDVGWSAPGETSAELLAELRGRGVAGRRVAVQRDGGRPVLAEALGRLGADVVDVPVYQWGPPADDKGAHRLVQATLAGRLHAVTFTCAQAVHSLFELVDDPDALRGAFCDGTRAVAVGPVTAHALRSEGVDHPVEPPRGRLGSMVRQLVVELSATHRVLRWEGHEVRWQGAALLAGDEHVSLLTPGEQRLLELLVQRRGSVLAKATLAEPGTDPHAVEAAVGRLRSKLGPLGGSIRAIPRRGYACDLTWSQAEPAEVVPR